MNLKGRDFLTLLDYTPEEIAYLVDLAAELKAKKKAGVLHDVLRGKNVALIFEKLLPAPAVPLRLPPTTWAWAPPIWIQRAARSAKGIHCRHRPGAVRHV